MNDVDAPSSKASSVPPTEPAGQSSWLIDTGNNIVVWLPISIHPRDHTSSPI